jgi:NAD(P)-dependent dehydrogenase (short-subunit alcohol dehydrogenase family)
MPTVLITGASRGLGLEFARQYVEAGWKVLACCREPAAAQALHGLAKGHPGLSIHKLDLARLVDVTALARELSGETIDVLLNNAGVYGQAEQNRFGSLDYDFWAEAHRINVQAPVRMAEAFLPQVLRSERKLIVAVTSLMGSIADNDSGGSIIYRSTKAALNAAMRSLSIDLRDRGAGVLLLHPGWVLTDMGGSNAPTRPEESIAGMRRVIDGFGPADSGRFVDFSGKELPW